MNRTQRLFLVAFLLIFVVAIAFAQAILPPDVDPGKPSTWFLTAAGWGGLVLLTVNFLKVNILHLKGFTTVVFAFILAVGGAFLAGTGLLSPFGISLEGTMPELLTFGITAFVSSAGSWDTGKVLLQKASET